MDENPNSDLSDNVESVTGNQFRLRTSARVNKKARLESLFESQTNGVSATTGGTVMATNILMPTTVMTTASTTSDGTGDNDMIIADAASSSNGSAQALNQMVTFAANTVFEKSADDVSSITSSNQTNSSLSVTTAAAMTTTTKKSLKSKSIWSVEERNEFFEAVNEYGKDIEAIHNYLVQKAKKRGVPEHELKNREQTRFYYYRTWAKISKFVTFSDDLKKVVQELYALINYGELRKKIKCVKEKMYAKLNELIYRGFVKIPLKKKTIRVRTPMCPALRKLNAIDDNKHEEFKLPPQITLELRPRNNQTWLTVQSLSQNPRIKTVVSLQYRVKNLLSFLAAKWTVTQHQSDKVLHLGPKSGTVFDKPLISLSNYWSSSRISLNAYEERIGMENRSETLWMASRKFTTASTKRLRMESVAATTAAATAPAAPVPDKEELPPQASTTESAGTAAVPASSATEFQMASDEPMLNAWNVHNSDSLSIGQLYLMIGSESKLELEYWWESIQIDDNCQAIETSSTTTTEEGTTTATDATSSQSIADPKPEPGLSLTSSNSLILKRLLSLAKLYFSKDKPSISCSQFNSQVAKQNSGSAIPGQNKIFSKPLTPSSQPFHNADAFRAQIESLRNTAPRFCRRGRVTKKQIVQRVLPLLPKLSENPHSLVQMKLVPKSPQNSRIVPVASSSSSSSSSMSTQSQQQLQLQSQQPAFQIFVPNTPTSTITTTTMTDARNVVTATTAAYAPSSNVANFACVQQSMVHSQRQSNESDLSFLNTNYAPFTTTTTSTSIGPGAIATPTFPTTTSTNTFNNFNANEMIDDDDFDFFPNSMLNSYAGCASPSELLNSDNGEWLNTNFADFSFSSFLGQLDASSPSRFGTGANAVLINNEDTRFSISDLDNYFTMKTTNDVQMDDENGNIESKFAILSSKKINSQTFNH